MLLSNLKSKLVYIKVNQKGQSKGELTLLGCYSLPNDYSQQIPFLGDPSSRRPLARELCGFNVDSN